jgi:exonuclease VII small subunit
MELLSLTQYLEKTANPKRAAKLVKRSVKLYRHATKDLAHAECDLAHAKEDCLHTIEAYENTLEDTKQYLADWARIGDGSETVETEIDDEDIFSGDFDEEDEDGEEESDVRLGDHLDHAAEEFKHAMKDANDALENLEQIDEYIEELLDDAEEEGFELSLTEVKAEIIRRAGENTPDAAEPSPAPAA